MLKTLAIAALTLPAAAALAGDHWTDFNFDSASYGEKKAFVVKHAYKTLSAPDAYTIACAVDSLPGNRASALVNGLARNAWQAKMIKDEKQMAANMMPPMGTMWTEKDWSNMDSATAPAPCGCSRPTPRSTT